MLQPPIQFYERRLSAANINRETLKYLPIQTEDVIPQWGRLGDV